MKIQAPKEAYPLTWPVLRARTPGHARRDAKFKLSFGDARTALLEELHRLGARNVVLSSNIPTRRDGLPFATYSEPLDPGIAVYFDRWGLKNSTRSYVIACDGYRKAVWNLRAVGVTVEAFRAIQRHGATEMLEQAFTGFAALPPGPSRADTRPWWQVFGLTQFASLAEVHAAYKDLARKNHPDVGGDVAAMALINVAYEEAKEACGVRP